MDRGLFKGGPINQTLVWLFSFPKDLHSNPKEVKVSKKAESEDAEEDEHSKYCAKVCTLIYHRYEVNRGAGLK